MKKDSVLLAVSGLLGGALASLAGYQLGTARANVPSPASRLFYSGQVSTGAAPLTGEHTVEVAFFPTLNGGTGVPVCSSISGTTNPANGQFRVDVSACDAALKAQTDVFVQLTIDRGAAAQILLPPDGSPRPRLGAVPFAVQSEDAITATTVPFSGVTGTNVVWPGTSNKVVYTVDAKSVSVGIPCGRTATPHNGNLGGYPGAKTFCETACGKADAHMCTWDEVSRFWQAGGITPNEQAWISTPFAAGAATTSGVILNDCNGWSSNDGSSFGAGALTSATNVVGDQLCSVALKIQCCATP